MDRVGIVVAIILFALSFYLIFLVIGVGGISKNLKAQNLVKNQQNNK